MAGTRSIETVRWHSFNKGETLECQDVCDRFEITVSYPFISLNDYGKLLKGLHLYNCALEAPADHKNHNWVPKPEGACVELTGSRLLIGNMGVDAVGKFWPTIEKDAGASGAKKAFVVVTPGDVALAGALEAQGFTCLGPQQDGAQTYFMKELQAQEGKEALEGASAWELDLKDPVFPAFQEGFGVFVRDADGFVQGGATGALVKSGENSHAEVQMFFMEESVRGTGFGKLIMDFVEDFVRTQNLHQIALSTSDYQAPWFYEKIGYQRILTLPGYTQTRDGQYSNAYVYLKTL